MKRSLLTLTLAASIGASMAAELPKMPQTAAPANAKVYIIAPTDGAIVGRTVTVRFGLEGMGVAPAGVDKENTGHHHLLIDVETLPATGQPIPNDASHLHFGGGQTETSLQLSPGMHTLQLELADAHHVPFRPVVVSKKITIEVR